MIRYDHKGHKKKSKSYIYEDKANHDTYYFEIYEDSLIDVEVIEQGDAMCKIAWVVIIVDGAAYHMHQRKFEAGRPQLRKGVEVLAETLRGIKQSFHVQDIALSSQIANLGNIEDILG